MTYGGSGVIGYEYFVWNKLTDKRDKTDKSALYRMLNRQENHMNIIVYNPYRVNNFLTLYGTVCGVNILHVLV